MDHLQRSAECPNGILLIVDEAHTLPLKLLEEIRMITNVVRGDEPRVRLIVAGGPTLEERFASPKLESLNQRIVARCYLESMNREETTQYVSQQITTVGEAPDKIFSDDAFSAIHIANLARRSSLVRRTKGFIRYPQILRNVQVREKPDFDTLDGVPEIAREIEAALGDSGRLLLRYSGTEPVARVMIEGRDRALISGQAERLAERIRAEIGAT